MGKIIRFKTPQFQAGTEHTLIKYTKRHLFQMYQHYGQNPITKIEQYY